MLVEASALLRQRNRKLLPTRIYPRQLPVAIASVLVLCLLTPASSQSATSAADASAQRSSLESLTGGHDGNDPRGPSLGEGENTAAPPPSGPAPYQRSWETLRLLAALQGKRQQTAAEQAQAPVAEAPQEGQQVQPPQQQQQVDPSEQQMAEDGTCHFSSLAGGVQGMQCGNGVPTSPAAAPVSQEDKDSAVAVAMHDTDVRLAPEEETMTPGKASSARPGSSLVTWVSGVVGTAVGRVLGDGKDTAAPPQSGPACYWSSWETLKVLAASQNGGKRQQTATEQAQAPAAAEAPQGGQQVQQQQEQQQQGEPCEQPIAVDGACNSSTLAGGQEVMQSSNRVHASPAGVPAAQLDKGPAGALGTQDANGQLAPGEATMTPGKTPSARPGSPIGTWVSGCVVGMAVGWALGVAWERRRQQGARSSQQAHQQGKQTAQGGKADGNRGGPAADSGACWAADKLAVAGRAGDQVQASGLQRSATAACNGQQREAERKQEERLERQLVRKVIVTAEAGDAAPEAAAAQPPGPAAASAGNAGVMQASHRAEPPGAPTTLGVNGGSPGGAAAHGLGDKEAERRSRQEAVQPVAPAVGVGSHVASGVGRAVSSCPVSPEPARSGPRSGDGHRDEEGTMARTRSCPRSRGPGLPMGHAGDGREGGRAGRGVRRLVLGGEAVEGEGEEEEEEEEESVGQRALSRSSSCSSTAGMATDSCPTGTSANQPRRRLTWDDGDMRQGGERGSRRRGALGANSSGWLDGAGAGGVQQGSDLQSAAADLQRASQRAASPEDQMLLAAAATALLQHQHYRQQQQQQQLCGVAGGQTLALPPAGGGALVPHPGGVAGMGVGPVGYLQTFGQAGTLAVHPHPGMGVGAGMVAHHQHQSANVQSALILAAAAESFGQHIADVKDVVASATSAMQQLGGEVRRGTGLLQRIVTGHEMDGQRSQAAAAMQRGMLVMWVGLAAASFAWGRIREVAGRCSADPSYPLHGGSGGGGSSGRWWLVRSATQWSWWAVGGGRSGGGAAAAAEAAHGALGWSALWLRQAWCYAHELGLFSVGLLLLVYLVWPALRHTLSLDLKSSWMLDVPLLLGCFWAALGAHAVHCLGGYWTVWLALWWAWCVAGGVLHARHVRTGWVQWAALMVVAVVGPVAMAGAPFLAAVKPVHFVLEDAAWRAVAWAGLRAPWNAGRA